MSVITTTTRLRRWAQILFFVVVVRPFMTLFIGLRVRGPQHLTAHRPCILIANHSSHLDTVSLLSLFPLSWLARIRPCGAVDYFESNRFRSFCSKTFFNILPVARTRINSDNHPILRMQEALRNGDSLLFFPEGTRNPGQMSRFKPGISHLVEAVPEVPIVPAYLVNMGRSLPKGEYLPVPFFCEVRIGPPRFVQGTRQEILEELERAVAELGDDVR